MITLPSRLWRLMSDKQKISRAGTSPETASTGVCVDFAKSFGSDIGGLGSVPTDKVPAQMPHSCHQKALCPVVSHSMRHVSSCGRGREQIWQAQVQQVLSAHMHVAGRS